MQKTKIFNREYDSVMITTLNLENRCIKELPKEIGDFMNLEILRL